MRLTICELSEFSGRTHKLGLYVWVSGHSLTLLQSNPDIFCVLYDHRINIYMIDQFLSVYGFYIRFIYQIQYVH